MVPAEVAARRFRGGPGERQLGKVGAEQHLVAAVGFDVVQQLRRVVAGEIGRGVDVHVVVFPGDADHLVGPGMTDVAADDAQLGKGQRHFVEVGHGPAGFRRHQRPGVSDLCAEGDVELDALHIQREVELVVRRAVPQPGHDAQGLEPQLDDGAVQLANGGKRFFQIDGRHADEPRGKRADELGDLVVGDDPLAGTTPGAEQHAVDACLVHQRHDLLGRKILVQQMGRAGSLEQPSDFGHGGRLDDRLCPGVDDWRAGRVRHDSKLGRARDWQRRNPPAGHYNRGARECLTALGRGAAIRGCPARPLMRYSAFRPTWN